MRLTTLLIAAALCVPGLTGAQTHDVELEAPLRVHTTTMFYGMYYPGDRRLDDPKLTINQGDRLLFINMDFVVGEHSLTEMRPFGDLESSRFEGKPIPPGNWTEVIGVDRLEPGTYLFYCTTHGPYMQGTLHVT